MSDELEALIEKERGVHHELLARRDRRDLPLKQRLEAAKHERKVLEIKLSLTRTQLDTLTQRIESDRRRLQGLALTKWEQLRARVVEPVLLSAALFAGLLVFGLVADAWRGLLLLLELGGGLVGTMLIFRRAR